MSHMRGNTSCSQMLESIEAYLDGELPAREVSLFESHIAECARCRRELELAQAVLQELHGLPEIQCPNEVTRRVLDRAGESSELGAKRPAHPQFLPRWFGERRGGPLRAALAGAAAVVIVISGVLWQRHEAQRQQFTPTEIKEAEAVVRWTFAYVNDLSVRSGFAVRDQVFGTGVVDPVKRAVHSAIDIRTSPKPDNNNGG